MTSVLRIPIFCGDSHLGFIRDEATLRRYLSADNVTSVKKHKKIIRVDVSSVAEEPDKGRGIGPNSMRSFYEEELSSGPMITLKRVKDDGDFVRWSDRDGFNPRRFNPDTLVGEVRKRGVIA